jgi:hypothetical protein
MSTGDAKVLADLPRSTGGKANRGVRMEHSRLRKPSVCQGENTRPGDKALSSSTSSRLSGKAMARTGLRMMPTFPSPPLKFRTAGFPQYGFKAGLSDEAFPVAWFAIVLRAHCLHRVLPALCQG